MVCNISAQNNVNVFSNLFKLRNVTSSKLLQNNKQITSSCLNDHKITKSTSSTKTHCVSRTKLLTSGNIELNPGPEQNLNIQTILSVGSTMVLNLRLCQLGLRPVDVGGEHYELKSHENTINS